MKAVSPNTRVRAEDPNWLNELLDYNSIVAQPHRAGSSLLHIAQCIRRHSVPKSQLAWLIPVARATDQNNHTGYCQYSAAEPPHRARGTRAEHPVPGKDGNK